MADERQAAEERLIEAAKELGVASYVAGTDRNIGGGQVEWYAVRQAALAWVVEELEDVKRIMGGEHCAIINYRISSLRERMSQ